MNNFICPLCGGTKIVQVYQTSHAQMIPVKISIFRTSSDKLADICGNCVYIITLKVKNTEYFIEK